METVEIEVGNILGNTYKIVIDVMDRKVYERNYTDRISELFVKMF